MSVRCGIFGIRCVATRLLNCNAKMRICVLANIVPQPPRSKKRIRTETKTMIFSVFCWLFLFQLVYSRPVSPIRILCWFYPEFTIHRTTFSIKLKKDFVSSTPISVSSIKAFWHETCRESIFMDTRLNEHIPPKKKKHTFSLASEKKMVYLLSVTLFRSLSESHSVSVCSCIYGYGASATSTYLIFFCLARYDSVRIEFITPKARTSATDKSYS